MNRARIAPRLRRLPVATVLAREVAVADGVRSRLLGLALLDREQVGAGLLIPRCAGVHTFGMRFALDLVFLDEDGRPLSASRAVPPRRLRRDRRASAVLELPSRGGRLLTVADLAAQCCPSDER
jgi:uncharacterized membrane protein (UPF0127 family)